MRGIEQLKEQALESPLGDREIPRAIAKQSSQLLRLSQQDNLALRVMGLVEIFGSGYCPEAIPDEEIAAIKTLMTSVLPYDSHPYLHEGMQVEVIRGPLQGVQGILLRKEKRHRLVLGVRLIQQAAAVEIDVNDVVPV